MISAIISASGTRSSFVVNSTLKRFIAIRRPHH
jgi:hypothetical protein